MPHHISPSAEFTTVEACVTEARDLLARSRTGNARGVHQRLRDTFTVLAGGDPTVGDLAYYLWRRRARRQR